MHKTLTIALLSLSFAAGAQTNAVNTFNEPYPAIAFATSGAGFTNCAWNNQEQRYNISAQATECWASWAGEREMVSGILCGFAGIYELTVDQSHDHVQSGEEWLASATICAGLGYMLVKIGKRYDETHPYQPEHHWHSNYHYHYRRV